MTGYWDDHYKASFWWFIICIYVAFFKIKGIKLLKQNGFYKIKTYSIGYEDFVMVFLGKKTFLK